MKTAYLFHTPYSNKLTLYIYIKPALIFPPQVSPTDRAPGPNKAPTHHTTPAFGHSLLVPGLSLMLRATPFLSPVIWTRPSFTHHFTPAFGHSHVVLCLSLLSRATILLSPQYGPKDSYLFKLTLYIYNQPLSFPHRYHLRIGHQGLTRPPLTIPPRPLATRFWSPAFHSCLGLPHSFHP